MVFWAVVQRKRLGTRFPKMDIISVMVRVLGTGGLRTAPGICQHYKIISSKRPRSISIITQETTAYLETANLIHMHKSSTNIICRYYRYCYLSLKPTSTRRIQQAPPTKPVQRHSSKVQHLRSPTSRRLIQRILIIPFRARPTVPGRRIKMVMRHDIAAATA